MTESVHHLKPVGPLQHQCIKCNITIDDYYTPDESNLYNPSVKLVHPAPGETNPDNKFICEDCILNEYMSNRVRCFITGKKFKPIPELEKLISLHHMSRDS